ncbi:MAG: DUF2017 family protein [Acidimicrobiales bacterium]
MPFFRRRRLFEPAGGDGFSVNLTSEARTWLVAMADQLEALLTADTDDTRRLFPTAYPDDPELDAGYQILAREQLIDDRREAIELLRMSADADTVTGDQLTAWMGIINDLRLVLGTRLDVSEDDTDIDFDDPNVDAYIAYHELGLLLSDVVDALTSSLPPPSDT